MKSLIVFYGCVLGLLAAVMLAKAQVLRKQIPDKLVVLTFDDAPKSHYSFVAPLLKKYGFDATFYVCEFPPDYSDTSKYMSWAEIKRLSDMGFEIGNHTRNHAHVNKLKTDSLQAEIRYIEKKCDSLHIQKPTSFAYPGYSTSTKALETFKSMGYATARIGGDTVYHPLADNPYYVPSFSTAGTDKEKVLGFIQQAKNGNIVVLTIHGVPDLPHPWVTTPPALFEEYLQYLKENNYIVISMRTLMQYINTEEAHKLPLPLSTQSNKMPAK